MLIRTATIDDLSAIARVEAECFPPAEAATTEEFKERLEYYANHFWLMFDNDKLIAFVDGFCTDEPDLTDEMYAKAQNRSGLVLTCKNKLINYYSKFGFKNEGISESTHGDVQWYQMRLTLKKD